MATFNINNRLIGDGHPAFIIAEIGNNHNGDLDMAKSLIREAKNCGADSAKFQIKNIEKAFPQELLDQPYDNINSFGKTYREHKQALEFSFDQYKQLKYYCDEIGIEFFATPFDLDSVEFLEQINSPAYKIASFHLTDNTLLTRIVETNKPIIMSTGMSSIDEIDSAVDMFKKNCAPFALLQCTSSYPTNDEDVHLSVIAEFKKRYGQDTLVGYSGHDRGITIPAISVCFGASIIEKHFTLDRTLKGPDHACSLEIKGFKGMVERTRLIEKAIGNPNKQVLDCELKNRKKFRGY
jgi:sialic acid synthase